ncbi:hypothetical protein BC628DRAFT_791097 [Trametes gibbosa]|nr:hypothetical protein BC628DRAFT_791097 [Trametes gibbosa]
MPLVLSALGSLRSLQPPCILRTPPPTTMSPPNLDLEHLSNDADHSTRLACTPSAKRLKLDRKRVPACRHCYNIRRKCEPSTDGSPRCRRCRMLGVLRIFARSNSGHNAFEHN